MKSNGDLWLPAVIKELTILQKLLNFTDKYMKKRLQKLSVSNSLFSGVATIPFSYLSDESRDA